jgi:hypothetical protein
MSKAQHDGLECALLGDKTFYPDYFMTGHSTHYLRLNVLTGTKDFIDIAFRRLDGALKAL